MIDRSILMLISAILNVLLGGYVFFQNKKSILNLTLASFAFSISGWIFSIWGLLNINTSLLMGELPFIFAYFFLAFLVIFVYELSPKFKHGGIVFAVMLSSATVMTVLTLLSQVITSVKIEGNFIINTFGPAYNPAVLLIVFYIIFILVALVYKYRISYGLDRLRLKYVLLGIAIFLIISVMTNLLLPTYFNIWSLNTTGPASSTFMIGAIAYAILRYHLLDIWFVIRLGTIFTLLFGVISIIYMGFITLFNQYLGISNLYSLVLSSFIITFTFEPLKKFVESITDRILFSRHYKVEEVVNELTSLVHQLELNLNKILIAFSELIKKYFKVEKVGIAILTPKGTFFSSRHQNANGEQFELLPDNPLIRFFSSNLNFIFNKDEIMQNLRSRILELPVENIELIPEVYEKLTELDFTIAMPVEYNGKLIGIYFIGEKKSKDFFTPQDLKLLEHLTGEIGSFINNARQYEDLKKLDEAKSNFISVVSHQLRTPLSAMRWTTELLLGGGVDKKTQKEFLKDNYKNSIFMIYHLDDMLTALDIENKQVELKKENCKLKDLIDEIIKDNRQAIDSKKLEILVKIDKEAGSVYCDCKKLKKILEILILNAINYTAVIGGWVAINAKEKLLDQSKFIEISVTDNGIGVTGGEQGYIFEKFFRGEEAKKITPNGFGLGLFIVKAFAKAHGGDVYFESAGRNKGARFYFTIKALEH